jgi:exopolyphosphatase/guanosine-5'-triphosphate,3'-diphosphate pyrophosphatase
MTLQHSININSSEKRIALFDIGSNSVRMVVFEPPYIGEPPIFNEKIMCGLGRDLERTGRLNPEAKERTLRTLAGFKALCNAMDITEIAAIATAAMRDAQDGEDFAQDIRTALDIPLKIISGEEEAELAALGVVAAFPKASGIIGDLGGGSLELALLKKGHIGAKITTKLGVLRIAARDDPDAYITQSLESLPKDFAGKKNFYVIGGTWRALGQALLMDKSKKNTDVHGLKIKTETLIEFSQSMADKPPAYFIKHFHFEQKRSELMPIAAKLMTHMLPALAVKTVIVSTSGLREGLLQAYLDGRL